MDSVLLIKLVSAMIYPLGMAFLCAILAILLSLFGRRKTSRMFAVISLAVIALASNPQVASHLANSLESQYPQQELNDITQHDAIIVLGGGVRIPLPPAKHTQIGHGSDRYWYAARLYKAGKAKQIFILGGNVYAQDGFYGEAYYARELLQEWGVPESAIVIESVSRTTAQSMNNSENLLLTNNVNSALLVTSALHMPRSYELFTRLPIAVTPASCDVLVRQKETPEVLKWLPSSGALELSTKSLHEYYGIWFAQVSK